MKDFTAEFEGDIDLAVIFKQHSLWRKFYGVESQGDVKAGKPAKAQKLAAEKPVKEPKVESNGVKRPYANTKCGEIWVLADKMSKEKGSPVSSAELTVESDKLGYNRNNVTGEYFLWRKFYGIGKVSSPNSVKKVSGNLENQIAAAKAKLEKAQAVYDELVAKRPAPSVDTEISTEVEAAQS